MLPLREEAFRAPAPPPPILPGIREAQEAPVPIVVQRSFTITPGSLPEFERLSREEIWPYMEARGCKVLGLFTNLHGGPSNEVILHTAYDSMAHWESTRPRNPPPDLSPEVAELARRAGAAVL